MEKEKVDSRVLKATYMTTKEIADKWNEENYTTEDVFEEWTSKKVSSKITYIFRKLKIMEYLLCYKVNKSFDFSRCISDMEQNISYFTESKAYMSKELKELSKSFEKSFEELKECARSEKGRTKQGDYIFNKEAFLEEDLLKRVIEIVDKTEIKWEEWEEMVECLMKLQPESNNPYMMKEIATVEKSQGEKSLDGFEIDCYIEMQIKKEKMKDVLLREKYFEYNSGWYFDLLNDCSKEYEIILLIIEEITEKYKALLETVEKIRIIEKCLGNEIETPISIENIFQWNLFAESRKKVYNNKEVGKNLNKEDARKLLEKIISEFINIQKKVELDETDKNEIRLKFMVDLRYIKKIYAEKNDEQRKSIRRKCNEDGCYGTKIGREDINKYEWILAMEKLNRSIS